MYESVVLKPGEGRTFPGVYLGKVGAAQLAVTWYAEAACDSADCGTTSDGAAPAPKADIYVNGPSGPVYSDTGRPLPISQTGYQWALSGKVPANTLLDVRLRNAGNVPITAQVHRDLA